MMHNDEMQYQRGFIFYRTIKFHRNEPEKLIGLWVESCQKKCDKNTQSYKFWKSIYTSFNQMCLHSFLHVTIYLFNDSLCQIKSIRMSEMDKNWKLNVSLVCLKVEEYL